MATKLFRYQELQSALKDARAARNKAFERDTSLSFAVGLFTLVTVSVVLYITKNFGLHGEQYITGGEGVPISILLAIILGLVTAVLFYNILGRVSKLDRELNLLSYRLREAADAYLEEAVAGRIVRLHDYGTYRLGYYEKISIDFGDAVRSIYARLSADGKLDWRLKK